MNAAAYHAGPELVFALVAPVGTDLRMVVDVLRDQLDKVGYKFEEIRLSSLLLECHRFADLRKKSVRHEDKRIDQLMTAGDELREAVGSGDAMIRIAVPHIRARREKISGAADQARPRAAYLLNSLKHPAEIVTLRKIYGDACFVLSIYSPRPKRIDYLAERIADSRDETDSERFRKSAEKLVVRDAKEVDNDLGQNVRDAFPKADFFIEMGQRDSVVEQISRFVRLLFAHPFETPTRDEYCMFHARAAAMRSADLSRQVGSAIVTDRGEIISVGCNEVPHFGGGPIWVDDEDKDDFRDCKKGEDSSVRYKHEVISELFKVLKSKSWLSADLSKLDPKELTERALYKDKILKDTRVANIIEFGRIVHAEMAAISDAARRGLALRDTILFCTTFPCHMCARHIIASGIKKVVFIEPYPKSLAKQLYDDLLEFDGASQDTRKVRFDPFVGVAPRRYLQFFEMPERRKDERGRSVTWVPLQSHPRLSSELPTHIDIEAAHLLDLKKNGKNWGVFGPESA